MNGWRLLLKFEERWQFPNFLGAVDGKHLVLQPPPASGSHSFKYEKSHSLVLMAVAGPHYECLCSDVGTNGRVSDSRVWNKCSLLQSLADNTLPVPPRPLPYGNTEMPYVFMGDDAFALRSFLMKPFPKSRFLLIDASTITIKGQAIRKGLGVYQKKIV